MTVYEHHEIVSAGEVNVSVAPMGLLRNRLDACKRSVLKQIPGEVRLFDFKCEFMFDAFEQQWCVHARAVVNEFHEKTK